MSKRNFILIYKQCWVLDQRIRLFFPANHDFLSAVSIFKLSTLCTDAQDELIGSSASTEKS